MSNFKSSLDRFSQDFFSELKMAKTPAELESVRVKFVGRNGQLATLMAGLKELSMHDKKECGPILNTLKSEALQALHDHAKFLEGQKEHALLALHKNFDVTVTYHRQKGSLHPFTYIGQEIENTFISMGFAIIDGPEVETPFYNFEALNIPEHHPARDMHDTFWLEIPGLLLRTHTSSVQVHAMKEGKLPLAVCAPGRVYRHEATDATHDFVFRQVEMLVVDKNISIAHLLGLIKVFLQSLFNTASLDVRVRPSYFPFVEPGLEVDMSCPFCTSGCSTCKMRRWIEMGGAGLVHPNVLRACGIDPEQWGGCAFGFGLERLAMLKYQINDIRLFKTSKIDFLKQF